MPTRLFVFDTHIAVRHKGKPRVLLNLLQKLRKLIASISKQDLILIYSSWLNSQSGSVKRRNSKFLPKCPKL